ncbi:unnamed protein product, partial [Ectocarpus sp. 8 AP-2014]
VAVKEFVFAQAAISGGSLQRNELIEEIVGEAAIMSVLQHPRILHLYGCSLTSQAIWIVSELCPRGSLRQVLDDRGTPLAPRARLRVAVDVAEGMLYLHSREEPVIHRDLKSHNIFMMEERDCTSQLLGCIQPVRADTMATPPPSSLANFCMHTYRTPPRFTCSFALHTHTLRTSLPPPNVLRSLHCSGQLQPKIGDWGSARALALYTGVRSMTHGVGTTCWLAPEV